MNLDWSELELAFNSNDGINWFLDTESGELRVVLEEDMGGESNDKTLALITSDPSRHLLLDPIQTSVAYSFMEDFANTQKGKRVRETLHALNGRRPFRRFSSAIAELAQEDSWYPFKSRLVCQAAARWLESNGISCEIDSA